MRQTLINQGYRLKAERIICDKNRFYEAIYVSKSADQTLVDTGSQMWNWPDPMHQDYWHRTVGHYQQKAKNDSAQFQPIVERYQLLRAAIENTAGIIQKQR